MKINSNTFLAVLLVLLLASCNSDNGNGVETSSPTPLSPVSDQSTSQSESEPVSKRVEEPDPPQPEEGKSYLFVEHETDGDDDGVERLIASMEREGLPFYQKAQETTGIIGSDDVVLLKINCQWAERGGTNVDLLESVVKAILSHPDGFTGEIIIADNGQGQYGTNGTGGSLSWPRNNAKDQAKTVMSIIDGYHKEHRVSGYLWDEIALNQVEEYSAGDASDGFVIEDALHATGLEVSYPKFTTAYGTQVSFKHGVWDESTGRYDSDRLKVINMPVLKRHSIYKMTGAVKAYMGVVANRLTNHRPHNNVGNGAMGTLMAETRMPALNIMDMVWIGADGGPGTTYDMAENTRMIAASTDPVALDYWAAKHVLMPGVEEQYREGIDPDSKSPGSFGYWLQLSAEELAKKHPVTMDTERIKLIE